MFIHRTLLLIVLFALITTETTLSQWTYSGNPSGMSYTRSQCFASLGNTLFVGTLGLGVHISTDKGNTWKAINDGIKNLNINALFAVNGTVVAGTQDGAFMTTDNGKAWFEVNGGLTNKNITALAIIGNNLLAGTSGGLFVFNLNTLSWVPMNGDLSNTFISSISTIGNNIFVGTYGGGVFMTTNFGVNWKSLNAGLSGNIISNMIVCDSTLFVATVEAMTTSIYVSSDFGKTWISANNGIPGRQEIYFAVNESNVFAGAYDKGVFLTSNKGASWKEVNEGFGTSRTIRALFVFENDLFAAIYDGVIYHRALSQMITGIETENDGLSEYTQFISPNPASDFIEISVGANGPSILQSEVRIYNVFGQTVSTPNPTPALPASREGVRIDVSTLAPGMYFVRIWDRVGKFLKIK